MLKKFLGVLLVIVGAFIILSFISTGIWAEHVVSAFNGLVKHEISLFNIVWFLGELLISPGTLATLSIVMIWYGIHLMRKSREIKQVTNEGDEFECSECGAKVEKSATQCLACACPILEPAGVFVSGSY